MYICDLKNIIHKMKLSHFHFDLPEELLAEYPSEHRDESRLMVLNRKDQTIEHKMFKDLIDYFDEEYSQRDFLETKRKLERELRCFY